MKKIIPIIIIAVLAVAGVLGVFWMQNNKTKTNVEDSADLTKIQKVITKDLTKEYPETPRGVVKFFNNIITCYYNEDWTEEEINGLASQAWILFDIDLQNNNESFADYVQRIKTDVEDYHTRKRTISQTSVCESNQVEYVKDKDKGDELAYVKASYFVKEGSAFDNTYETYVLRKDVDGKWRILVFYQIDKDEATERE